MSSIASSPSTPSSSLSSAQTPISADGPETVPAAGRRAIVLGAGMAGMVAARALSTQFDEVLVFDRDHRPADSFPDPAARKGVPQGQHIHLLLKAGQDALDELFPGFVQSLRDDPSVPKQDFMRDVAWKIGDRFRARAASTFESFPQTRPALEARVRAFLREVPNVYMHWGLAWDGFLTDPGEESVRAVRLVGRDDGVAVVVPADLVVDATGRGSKLPKWLLEYGFGAPREESIEIGLAYTSGIFRKVDGFDWTTFAKTALGPDLRRGAFVQPIDAERWIVTITGYLGDHPPTTAEGFLEAARAIDEDDLYPALRASELLEPIRRFKIPRQVRRRYDEMAKLPKGIIAFGDSICAFDPAFGQGMTVAALEAQALARLLREDDLDVRSDAFARAFYREAYRIGAVAWDMTSSEAMRFAEIGGRRSPALVFQHWFLDRLHEATLTDLGAQQAFLRVMHMIDRPESLFAPSILWKILRAAVRGPGRRQARKPATAYA